MMNPASESTAIHRPVSILMFVRAAPPDFMPKIMIMLVESVETVGMN